MHGPLPELEKNCRGCRLDRTILGRCIAPSPGPIVHVGAAKLWGEEEASRKELLACPATFLPAAGMRSSENPSLPAVSLAPRGHTVAWSR